MIPLTLALLAGPPHLPIWPQDLQVRVLERTRRFDGALHLYVEDLKTGTRYGHNALTPAYLASGVKIAVLIELFRAVRDGEASLSETVVLGPDDVRDGAPLLGRLPATTEITVAALAEAMIQASDNAATDLLVKRLGLHRVNQVLLEEGLVGFGPITPLIDVRRLVYREIDPRGAGLGPEAILALAYERPLPRRLRALERHFEMAPASLSLATYEAAYHRYYRSGHNSGSMEAMGKLLAGLARGTIVSEAASAHMVGILLGTRTGAGRIRAGLPPELPFAHKTGTQHHRTCDFGVMFLPPRGRAVVVAASVSGPSRAAAEDLLAAVGAAIYAVLGPGDARSPEP